MAKRDFDYVVMDDDFRFFIERLPTATGGRLLKDIFKNVFDDDEYDPHYEDEILEIVFQFFVKHIVDATLEHSAPGLKHGYQVKRGRNEPGYASFRRAVLSRDGYKCQMCGATKNLHVHHIKPYSEYKDGRTDPNNGITLCAKCHRKVHSKHGDL